MNDRTFRGFGFIRPIDQWLSLDWVFGLESSGRTGRESEMNLGKEPKCVSTILDVIVVMSSADGPSDESTISSRITFYNLFYESVRNIPFCVTTTVLIIII